MMLKPALDPPRCLVYQSFNEVDRRDIFCVFFHRLSLFAVIIFQSQTHQTLSVDIFFQLECEVCEP